MKVKIWGLLILLGGVLLVHGPAWGASCASFEVSTGGNFTVQQFINLGATGCDNGDKVYSSGSASTLLLTSTLHFDISGTVNSVAMTLRDGADTATATSFFSYNIAITDPTFFFAAVGLDSTCPPGLAAGTQCTVSKQEQSGPKFATLTSTDGGFTSTTIPGLQTTLSILDTLTVSPSGQLTSFSNAYTQQLVSTVPEPSTFIMLGIGLASLGVLRRRRA